MTIHKTPAWKQWAAPTENQGLAGWQAGRCAWCGYDETLVRDHCHDTGLIRGLLCRACNVFEGVSDAEAWEPWRRGDNTAARVGYFEFYTGGWGTDGIAFGSALSYYTFDERKAWQKQVVADLRAGGVWPLEAPWSEAATARREADMADLRKAMGWMSPARPGGVA